MGVDPAWFSNHLAALDLSADRLDSLTVIEHHAVHELHARGGTGVDHFFGVLQVDGNWFFNQHALARICGGHHPLFADSRWQWNVDRVDVIAA